MLAEIAEFLESHARQGDRLLIDGAAMGRTPSPWVLRYPAPRAGAAAERARLDEHSLSVALSVAGIARFNISPSRETRRSKLLGSADHPEFRPVERRNTLFLADDRHIRRDRGDQKRAFHRRSRPASPVREPATPSWPGIHRRRPRQTSGGSSCISVILRVESDRLIYRMSYGQEQARAPGLCSTNVNRGARATVTAIRRCPGRRQTGDVAPTLLASETQDRGFRLRGIRPQAAARGRRRR